jgi:hypothetical protein
MRSIPPGTTDARPKRSIVVERADARCDRTSSGTVGVASAYRILPYVGDTPGVAALR